MEVAEEVEEVVEVVVVDLPQHRVVLNFKKWDSQDRRVTIEVEEEVVAVVVCLVEVKVKGGEDMRAEVVVVEEEVVKVEEEEKVEEGVKAEVVEEVKVEGEVVVEEEGVRLTGKERNINSLLTLIKDVTKF